MRRVSPVVARKGRFIKSFPSHQYQDMLNYGYETEMAMFRHHIKGELVFTEIGKGPKQRRWSWQIFLLTESIGE